MHQTSTGQFLISLDFELLWGVRDKRTIETYGANIRGVRQVIPSLLQLFTTYNIRASWATVGFLFSRNKEELMSHIPSVLPKYNKDKFSPYEGDYFTNIGSSEIEDIYHYGHSLIQLIQQYPEQEIGTHTFSHFYCLEGASIEAFEADLQAAIKIARENGIIIRSIIFPRNQYTATHIAVCKAHGIIVYRGNETSALYRPRQNEQLSLSVRAAKLVDSYLPLTGHNTHNVLGQDEKEIINLPSSAFLRPWSRKLQLLDGLRLRRIKSSMTYAAKNGEAYHLWWHPHNFGVNLKENLGFLEKILKHYTYLHQQYGFRSTTMSALADEIRKKQ